MKLSRSHPGFGARVGRYRCAGRGSDLLQIPRAVLVNIPCLTLASFALLDAGCKPAAPPRTATGAPPAAEAPHHLPNAQTNLPVIKVYVGAHELRTECAMNPEQTKTGMMWRTSLEADAAMLFPLGRPGRASFNMLNTTVPLSAAYIDPNGTILEIHDLKPLDETPVESQGDQIQYVLEVNLGWFARHGVNTGAVVRTQFGALSETFVSLK